MELLNYARGNFCGMWVFAYSWGCCFVDAPVFSFSKKAVSARKIILLNLFLLRMWIHWEGLPKNTTKIEPPQIPMISQYLLFEKVKFWTCVNMHCQREKNTKLSHTLWQHIFFLSEGCINNTFINEFHRNWFNIHVNNILVSSIQFWTKC